MKVQLNQITEDTGFDVLFDTKDKWVVDVLENLLREDNAPATKMSGSLHLDKIADNVSVTGNIVFTRSVSCARCGSPLAINESVAIKSHLAPLYTSKEDREKHEDEEIELTKDDLEFSFYDKDRIDLDTILNDEIAMHLPYNYYCRENCLGNCPNCQKNLNEGVCDCPDQNVDIRWTALKDIKKPKK